MIDNSWKIELNEFCDDIRLDRDPKTNLYQTLKVLEIVDLVYKNSDMICSKST